MSPVHTAPCRALVATLAIALSACGAEGEGVRAVYDPGGAWLDAPFPSDAVGPAGWSALTGPPGSVPLQLLLDQVTTASGFGTNAPVFFRFEPPIPTQFLPFPHESVRADSPLQLVDIDARSPEYGRRIPLRWTDLDGEGTYTRPGLFAVAPVAGIPLRPRTTYAALVTTAFAEPDPAFTAALDGDGPTAASLRPLVDALPFLGLERRDLAVATVFTTADVTGVLDRVVRFLDERVEPARVRPELDRLYEVGSYEVFRTDYATPLFMRGDKPYALSGGAFELREDGLPVIQGWDRMRLSVTIPTDPALATPPPDGFPVAVYLHGTGGNYRTFANSSDPLEVAEWLAPLGIVGLGIDLPLHGPRGTDDTQIDLHSFNILQPESALHIHRQGAADLIYLLQRLERGLTLTRPDGTAVPLDPARVVVIGHSQGGLSAALALPWAGELTDGVVLSGTGGLLSITAVERKDILDFAELARDLLGFADGEALDELHPISAVLQTGVEPTDPVNYARAWFREDLGLHRAAPTDVLLTSGLRDDNVPFRCSEALAAAAAMPVIGQRYTATEAAILEGTDDRRLPSGPTVVGWDGRPVAAGLSQWSDGTHFVIFDEVPARDLVRSFVVDVLDGAAAFRPRSHEDPP